MKNLLKLLPVLLLGVACTLAQAQAAPTAKPAAHHQGPNGSMAKDCCMMKDGKMMTMTGGKMMPMTKDMTMADGTVCKIDGTCTKKDGTSMAMKDGQCMMMDGKMTDMDRMKHHGKMKAGHKMGAMKM